MLYTSLTTRKLRSKSIKSYPDVSSKFAFAELSLIFYFNYIYILYFSLLNSFSALCYLYILSLWFSISYLSFPISLAFSVYVSVSSYYYISLFLILSSFSLFSFLSFRFLLSFLFLSFLLGVLVCIVMYIICCSWDFIPVIVFESRSIRFVF